MRAIEKQKSKTRKDREAISQRVCAALLWSARGQHCEICLVRGDHRVSGTLGEASYCDSTKRNEDRTTTLRRLLIGAVELDVTKSIVLVADFADKAVFQNRTFHCKKAGFTAQARIVGS